MSAVQTRQLRKAYRDTEVLHGLDLDVEPGQVFGFLGPNGAGKTTTLRILLGLTRPTSGSASILGHDVTTDLAGATRLIGYVPDVPGFYDWMRATDVMDFAGRCHGLDAATIRTRRGALLEMAGLSGVTTRIGGYSRGMKQRLGIAQALLTAPELLILDEPTSALDPVGRHQVLDMVASLRGRTTVLFSTHILADVERVCDHVAILDHGRLLVQAPTQELMARRESRMRLRLSVTDPGGHAEPGSAVAQLRGDLLAEPWVRSFEDDPSGGWLLTLDDATAAGVRIPELITRRGLGLAQFEPTAATLEDVFLDLVGADGGAR